MTGEVLKRYGDLSQQTKALIDAVIFLDEVGRREGNDIAVPAFLYPKV